jgi:AcrR family transcriptional regulator
MKKVVNAANGLRERKKARTREAIIDAALDLFESKGFDATTIDDIAAAADVSPRTFFRYFESKLDVVMARNAPKEPTIGPLLAARPASEGPIEAMRQVMREELVAQVADPAHVRELQVVITTPSLRNLAREHFYEEEAEIASAFAERLGADEHDLAPYVIAGAVASAIWTVVDRWIADGAEPDHLEPMIDEAFALLASGLEPRAAAEPRRRRGPAAAGSRSSGAAGTPVI